MSIANTTNQANLLKKTYGSKLDEMVYGKSELATRCKKNTKFGGEDYSFSIRITPTAGTSNEFVEALASQAEAEIVKFTVPFKRLYTIMGVENELIARAKAAGTTGAFDDALKQVTKSGLESFSEKLSREFWSVGGGAMGQLATTTVLASTTLQLRVASDVLGLNPKQTLEFSLDDGTPAVPAGVLGAPDRLTINAINRTTGALTMSANLNTVAGITTSAFIFLRGTYSKGWAGQRGWVPTSDPTPGVSWMGHDRTTKDILRTSGMRVSGGGRQMIETLYDAGAEAKINGVKLPHLFVNPRDIRVLRKEVQTQVRYDGNTAKIGGKVVIDLDSGPCELISEPWVPQGVSWAGDAGQVELRTAGDCPEMVADENGKLFRFREGADAREGRLAAYGNIVNEHAGEWVAITWA
jgi:hypothetical protein